MAKGIRKVPGINASSTADISFILLIFFLVVTSMNSQEGLHVTLPKKVEDNEPPPEIKQNNILMVKINRFNKIFVMPGLMNMELFKSKYNIKDEFDVPVEKLKDIAKDFIKNEGRIAEYPEVSSASLTYTEYDEKGITVKAVHSLPSGKAYNITPKHVLTLTTDRETSYRTYFQVANELYAAYNELRDDLAEAEYGKKFADLDPNQQGLINEYYKSRIYEAEPMGYK